VDFAFAPGTQPELQLLQALLRDRTDGATLDTTVVDVAGVTTVTDFLHRVDTVEPLPVGDLLLGSHGNDTGWLEIDIDALSPRFASYRVVKEAFEDAARRGRLRIPPDMYTTAQGQRAPVRVLIKGCRVGQAPKFVDALKLLFGGKVPVIAPKHFLGVRRVDKRRRKKVVGTVGTFEYLSYSHEITSPTELKRPQILAALRAKGFQQFDATAAAPNPIPDLWDTWLPKDAKRLGIGKRPIEITVSLGRKIEKLTTFSGMGQYRHFITTLTEPISNPPAAVKTKAGFKTALSQQPKHQATWGPTGFPIWQQYGHASFDAFFDSFVWTPPKKQDADPFTWVGTRHEYNVLLPVVRPPMTGKATDKLIYNFFPPRGATTGTPFIELLESEAGLYYVSPGAP
jgi:hypothetical protein